MKYPCCSCCPRICRPEIVNRHEIPCPRGCQPEYAPVLKR